MVSVCLITYNHAKYIRNAIEGVLMQKVNFAREFIIADDFSTDGTREILLEYREKYPELIKLILQEKNVGAVQNWLDLIRPPQSKYIAYFEGDDCWTDEDKLQNQFDLLEKNDQFVICTHNASVSINGQIQEKKYVNDGQNSINTFDDILPGGSFPTASFLYRNNLLGTDDYEILRIAPVGDWIIQLLLLRHGDLFYLDNDYSIYNVHKNNLWGNLKVNEQLYSKLSIYRFIQKNLNLSKAEIEIVDQNIIGTYKGIIQYKADHNRFNVFKEMRNAYRQKKKIQTLAAVLPSIIPSRIKRGLKLLFKNNKKKTFKI